MDQHINNICAKVSKLLGLLWRIKNFLDFECKILFYNSYIQPNFDYCSTMWGTCSKTHIDKLYKLQKRVGRIILGDQRCSTIDMLSCLNWLSVNKRINYNILVLVFKCLNNKAPTHLQQLFTKTGTTHCYSIRNANNTLLVPKPRTEILRRSFQYKGAVLWNSLLPEIQTASKIVLFKKGVKLFLMNCLIYEYFCSQELQI